MFIPMVGGEVCKINILFLKLNEDSFKMICSFSFSLIFFPIPSSVTTLSLPCLICAPIVVTLPTPDGKSYL